MAGQGVGSTTGAKLCRKAGRQASKQRKKAQISQRPTLTTTAAAAMMASNVYHTYASTHEPYPLTKQHRWVRSAPKQGNPAHMPPFCTISRAWGTAAARLCPGCQACNLQDVDKGLMTLQSGQHWLECIAAVHTHCSISSISSEK